MTRCIWADWTLIALVALALVPMLGYMWLLFLSEIKSRFFK